jgi:hypothetical protein
MYFYTNAWLRKAFDSRFIGTRTILCLHVVFSELYTLWKTMGFEMSEKTIGAR